jgi:hypothetical protein
VTYGTTGNRLQKNGNNLKLYELENPFFSEVCNSMGKINTKVQNILPIKNIRTELT